MSTQWKLIGTGVVDNPHALIYESRNVRVIVGHENGRWHISMSVPEGYPTWDQIADARYHFITEKVDMVLILPPLEDYVNLSPPYRHVFHLWEVRDPGLPIERGEALQRTGEDGRPR